MTDETTPDPHEDRYDGLPKHWSDSAKETYVAVEDERGATFTHAEASQLYEACALIALADDCSARVRIDGLMITGSQGQPVEHPLINQERQARTAAMTALARLRPPENSARLTNSERARQAARARWQR